jgi:hypothetical protein
MESTASKETAKGLDLGTSRVVLATLDGDDVKFTPQRNAFVDIPYAKMTDRMLAKEGILHTVAGEHIYAYGNRAEEFAKFLEGDERHPMHNGVLNPAEPKNLEMIGLLIEELCGKAGKDEAICFSIPSVPEHESDLIFHERSVGEILTKLGYRVQSINEGLAVVFAELKDASFNGIGMSFGGGMCNICLSYLGLPVFTLATTRAGDYIDNSAASVTGETPTTVRLRKENGFRINGNGSDRKAVDHALSIYYGDVIGTAVEALETAMTETKKLPQFTSAIPIVCAGGTTMAGGFMDEMKKAINDADLPIKIAQIIHPKDPLNTTAKGALVAASYNM